MRLIDANEIKNVADIAFLNLSLEIAQNEESGIDQEIKRMRDFLNKFYGVLDSFPTIDAVPIVRCKDCKHRDEAKDCLHPENIAHYYDADGNEYDILKMVDDDHFCSYGERRDGA